MLRQITDLRLTVQQLTDRFNETQRGMGICQSALTNTRAEVAEVRTQLDTTQKDLDQCKAQLSNTTSIP